MQMVKVWLLLEDGGGRGKTVFNVLGRTVIFFSWVGPLPYLELLWRNQSISLLGGTSSIIPYLELLGQDQSKKIPCSTPPPSSPNFAVDPHRQCMKDQFSQVHPAVVCQLQHGVQDHHHLKPAPPPQVGWASVMTMMEFHLVSLKQGGACSVFTKGFSQKISTPY